MRRRDVVVMSAATAAALIWGAASAQETRQNYPSRPIRVPSSAGGVHDVIARAWADRVKSSLGSIVVENRSGDGASIASMRSPSRNPTATPSCWEARAS